MWHHSEYFAHVTSVQSVNAEYILYYVKGLENNLRTISTSGEW